MTEKYRVSLLEEISNFPVGRNDRGEMTGERTVSKPAMIDKEQLLEVVNTLMPFGKYAGRALVDLPEEYLLWFAGKGFPAGRLGELMALALLIRSEGLEELVRPLRQG